uniref:Uncharacterized protein n=1 Tax=Timema genevievae TaxID=629358 RepID=A0A7R9PI85_TIMGE|nr:unnamed protein product [Timema genevievae]
MIVHSHYVYFKLEHICTNSSAETIARSTLAKEVASEQQEDDMKSESSESENNFNLAIKEELPLRLDHQRRGDRGLGLGWVYLGLLALIVPALTTVFTAYGKDAVPIGSLNSPVSTESLAHKDILPSDDSAGCSKSFSVSSEIVKPQKGAVAKNEWQPFLQQFHKSKPMTPYLFEALEKLLRYLMNRCVKPDLMKFTGPKFAMSCHIHDEIQEPGGIKNIHISKKMLDYGRDARKRHHEYLEMKKQERSEEDKKEAEKRKLDIYVIKDLKGERQN